MRFNPKIACKSTMHLLFEVLPWVCLFICTVPQYHFVICGLFILYGLIVYIDHPIHLNPHQRKIDWESYIKNILPKNGIVEKKRLWDSWCPDCGGTGVAYTNWLKFHFCRKCSGEGIIRNCKCGKELYVGYDVCRECYEKNKVYAEKLRIEHAEIVEPSAIKLENVQGFFFQDNFYWEMEDIIFELKAALAEGAIESTENLYAFLSYKEYDSPDIDITRYLEQILPEFEDDNILDTLLYNEDVAKIQTLLTEYEEKHKEIFYKYTPDYSKAVHLHEYFKAHRRDV